MRDVGMVTRGFKIGEEMRDTALLSRAAGIMKALRLAAEGLDEVAIKLNMTPDEEDLKVAEAWVQAFHRASDTNVSVFNHAMEMRRG